MKKILFPLVEKYTSFAVKAREHLHRYPELSNEEFKTSAFIEKCLKEAGIDYYTIPGMTGLVGIIRGAKEGKTIALRADMDALPIQEDSNKPYRSKVDGVMHACGHDVHTAILLGTARVLQDARRYLAGQVKLFFQPAEETTGGAKRMIAAGCMANPSVDYVFGLHVDAEIPCGTLRTKAGAFNGAGDYYQIEIKGKKASATQPHLGANAIVAAAAMIMELQTITSRRISPYDNVVINVGTISGGTGSHVIADQADFSLMVRSTSREARRSTNEAIVTIIEQIAIMYGVEVKIDASPGYDTMYNSPACVELIRRVAGKMLGKDTFQYVEQPFMGMEDFCYFCKNVPGAFYQLGSRNEALGITAPTHSPQYDADPETVPLGMKMQAGIVFELIGIIDD